MMAQFDGAPPMAMLTVAGVLLVGHQLAGRELALDIAWTWLISTITGPARP